MNKPKVLVLLATYNGEKYLREQIDSILNQKDVDVFIKVADDKSKDGTQKILEEYKNKYSNFDYYINEQNKGFTYNFLDLYFSAKTQDFDYCAFADQDDFWMEEKLIKAIELIDKNDSKNGCVYCSNLKLVDSELKPLGKNQENEKILKASRYSFLVSNIATGCTMVMNKKFYDHSIKFYPKNIHLHDYYLFLVAVFTANYVYDINPYICYRQHGNNQIGSNKNLFTKEKFKAFIKPKFYTSDLSKVMLEGFEKDIYEADLDKVKMIAEYKDSFKKKNRLLFTNKIKARRFNLIFKLRVLFKKF